MSKGKRVALTLVIVAGLVVVALALIIPALINVDRYRPQLVAQLQRETGKPAQIGHLALTILPQVAIRVDDFSLGNPAGFPTGDFVKVKKIYAVVNASALWHHRVEITTLNLDNLTLNMLQDTHGKWNFENPPAPTATPAAAPEESKSSFTLGVISRLTIGHGEFEAANLLASGSLGPPLVQVHGATIDLRDVNLNGFTAASPGGTALAPSASTAGFHWFNTVVYAADQAGPMVAQGTIKADALRFGPLAVIKLQSRIRLHPKQVYLDGLDLRCYGGDAAGNLFLDFGGAQLAYRLDARVKDVKVADFLNAFPQTRGLMTGTLQGAAKMGGAIVNSNDPLAGVTGAGEGSIRNGQMPSLQIGGNLRSLARIAGVGPANGDPSAFSAISADFRIADARLSSNKITVVANGVDVDGAGSLTMAGEGSLDYHGNASLAASGHNPLTSVLAGVSGATISEGKITFPFSVAGTFTKPKFSLKGEGQHGTVPTAAEEPSTLVHGLAGRLLKKKQ